MVWFIKLYCFLKEKETERDGERLIYHKWDLRLKPLSKCSKSCRNAHFINLLLKNAENFSETGAAVKKLFSLKMVDGAGVKKLL